MSKYLKGYTLTERWETFKKQDVSSIHSLISAVEELSTNPSSTNIDVVVQLEKELQDEISKLNEADRDVLEDMIVRILYQAHNKLNDNYTRWEYTLSRAKDKNIYEWFEKINNEIMSSEDLITSYQSSGSSSDAYIKQQQEHLDNTNEVWNELLSTASKNELLSTYYINFFKKQLDRKRVVIERHIENFGDDIFGDWLKSIRIKKGWSLAKASEETNASPSYIHRIERGVRSVPSVTKLEQLADGYNIPHNKMIAMASGGIETFDSYIRNGAYTIKGKVATDNEMEQLAELASLISENDIRGAQDQLDLIFDMFNK